MLYQHQLTDYENHQIEGYKGTISHAKIENKLDGLRQTVTNFLQWLRTKK